MTDPRRVAAHLAEEIAAIGVPAPPREAYFNGSRLVAVCDVPAVATFGTDGLRVWWQVRGHPRRHRARIQDGGVAAARDALVRAVYSKRTSRAPAPGDRADDAGPRPPWPATWHDRYRTPDWSSSRAHPPPCARRSPAADLPPAERG